MPTSSSNPPVLEFRDVTFSYDGRRRLLENLSFRVGERETFVIVGQCGYGKSTLLKLAAGLLTPTTGQVLQYGRDLAAFSHAEILQQRQRIGYVFQNSALISNMTVWDNVALPLQYHRLFPREKIQRIVQSNIDLVGLQGFESFLPANLSMGSQKRAALARALVTYPSIVFYDEPTSGLDPVNAKAVTEVIRSLQTGFGITSMVVTHDIGSAFRLASTIAIVRDHKIYFTGTVEAVQNAADPYIRKFISPQAPGPE